MLDGIKVSIICNTYNHKNYIRDAIESFLMQKTNFSFEVLIHDDASTDGTADIIREYEKKYPDIIRPIYQKENQYSKGVSINNTYQFSRVRGKYIAICEGDDYWLSPLKLQKQYELMEKNPGVDICAHAAIKVEPVTKKELGAIAPSNEDAILSLEDVILGGGEYVATNSLLYRVELNQNIPEFRRFLSLDYTLQIQGALRGGILYLKDNMSAYRVMSKGSWTYKMSTDIELRARFEEKLINMLYLLNIDTNNRYDSLIQSIINRKLVHLCSLTGDYKKLLSNDAKYKTAYKHLSWWGRLKIRIKAYCPWLLKIRRKLLRKEK